MAIALFCLIQSSKSPSISLLTQDELNGGLTTAAISAVQEVNKRGHNSAYTTEAAPVIPTVKRAFLNFW